MIIELLIVEFYLITNMNFHYNCVFVLYQEAVIRGFKWANLMKCDVLLESYMDSITNKEVLEKIMYKKKYLKKEGMIGLAMY